MKSLILHTVIAIYHSMAAWLFIRHMHFELPKLQLDKRLETTPPHTFMTLWNFVSTNRSNIIYSVFYECFRTLRRIPRG